MSHGGIPRMVDGILRREKECVATRHNKTDSNACASRPGSRCPGRSGRRILRDDGAVLELLNIGPGSSR